MHLSKTTVTLNEPFTVSGSGCFNADAAIGELPSVLVLGPNVVVVHANSAGTWSATPTAPPTGPAAGCIACTRIASGSPLGAGWPVSLRYTGFQPGEQVTLLMHSTPVRLGIFTADESGVVTASVRIPDDATAGSHTLTFTGPVTGDRVVPFSVTAAAPVAPAPPAPARSATPTALAAAGAVVVPALVVGGVVVYRRRQAGPLRGR